MTDKKVLEKVPVTDMAGRLSLLLATGFGSGYSPVAPGTAGSLVAVLIYFCLAQLDILAYIVFCVAVTVLGCFVADRAGKHFGVVDAQQIVIDEIAGFLISMTGVELSFRALVAGFTLFRLFDVFKPWPASYFDSTAQGGFGVVMDDVAAGVYTLLCLQTLLYFKIL